MGAPCVKQDIDVSFTITLPKLYPSSSQNLTASSILFLSTGELGQSLISGVSFHIPETLGVVFATFVKFLVGFALSPTSLSSWLQHKSRDRNIPKSLIAYYACLSINFVISLINKLILPDLHSSRCILITESTSHSSVAVV